jgi:putative aminopeptidase FrvX
MDPLELLAELTALPAPPGQERAVREALTRHVERLGYSTSTDAKGNLLVPLSGNAPRIVVTAHMDEIAMIVRSVRPDGSLQVGALGGIFPWKLGEGPVQVLASGGPVAGVLSFGSIHTADPTSTVRRADRGGIEWDLARVMTGRSEPELAELGVRPGTRVVVAPVRRGLTKLNDLVAAYFLDDRADLVSWLLALESSKGVARDVLFVASAAEEVGGEGALFVLQQTRPDICIALELGPDVTDAPVDLTDQPTVWVNDSYSAMAAEDIGLLADLGQELGLRLQFQALSRGGSDASCAASHGLCGRPITLGLPMQNSHGYEIMHPGAMKQLAVLLDRLIVRLLEG